METNERSEPQWQLPSSLPEEPPPRLRALRRHWGTLVILLAVLAAALILPHLSWYNLSRTARVERGRVLAIGRNGARHDLIIQCPRGPVHLTTEQPTGIYAPQAAKTGDPVLVRFGADGPSLGPEVREGALLALIAVFCVVLALAGGPRALRAAVSLLVAFLLLLVVLIPLTLRGWSPLLVTVALSVVIAGGTIGLVAGRGRKSLAAFLGVLGGLLLAVGASLAVSWQLSLTGLSVDFAQYRELGRIFWQAEPLWKVDFAGLLVAGVVLSCLGAAMDVAITVATAVQEVVTNRPDLSRREVVRSGLSVGHAAVWMTAATLFFVLLGAGMEPFLARMGQHSGQGWMRLLSYEEMAVLVVRLAIAGLTMALVAPLTALFAGLLLAKGTPRSARQEGARGGPRFSPGALGRMLVVALFAVIVALGLVLADRLALGTIPEQAAQPDEAGFVAEQALARVLRVREPSVEHGSERPSSRGLPFAWHLVACQLLTGKFAGQTVLTNKIDHPNPDWNIVVREGELVILELAARGPITNVNFRKPALRYRDALCLLGVLFGALLLFGGWRSVRNTLGVMGIVALLMLWLFPLLLRGADPLSQTALFSAAVVGGVLLLFYGWDRKALAALAGTLGALAVVTLVMALASRWLKLHGLESAAGRWLLELREHGFQAFDYRGLMLAGLLVAVLGVTLDTSVSIAAGIEEVYRTHPAIERKAAVASGLAIGRDVMGVCATTFVFASIGVRLPMLLLPAAADLAPAEIVNTEAGCIEIVRILACGIGLLATAPLTTLAAVAIFRRGAAKPRRAGPRAARWWTGGTLLVEAVAIVALSVAIARQRPFEPREAPRFASLEAGTFEAVVDAANDLLARYDYPQAILLLWSAQERGIARSEIGLRLAHLYFDYHNYINYYEQSSLPPGMRATGATDQTGGKWAVHAEAELRAALAEEPAYTPANHEMGRLLASQGRAAEAIPYLEAAAEAEPDDVELLCDLAAACTLTERFQKAEAVAARLVQMAPDHPRVKQLLESLKAGEPQRRPAAAPEGK